MIHNISLRYKFFGDFYIGDDFLQAGETTLNKLAEILDTTKEYLTDTEILPYYQKLSSLRKEESINFVKKQLKEQELE